MISRRTLFLGIASTAAWLSLAVISYAQAATIDYIVSIIESAGSIVKKAADGIEAAYKTGTFIIDDQEARYSRDLLRQIESINNMIIVGQSPLLFQIEHYDLNSQYWEQLQYQLINVAAVIGSASTLLSSLAPKLPSTLSQQISDLASLYAGRGTLISQIRELPKPKTQADLRGIKKFRCQVDNPAHGINSLERCIGYCFGHADTVKYRR